MNIRGIFPKVCYFGIVMGDAKKKKVKTVEQKYKFLGIK